MFAKTDDEKLLMEQDQAGRVAVERGLGELESQVAAMLETAMEATGRSTKPAAGSGGWDTEMKRLDAAMCRLRIRLERCQYERGPAEASGSQPVEEAVQLASTELDCWRKLCGEVVQSISAASALMSQAMRDAEEQKTQASQTAPGNTAVDSGRGAGPLDLDFFDGLEGNRQGTSI